MTLRSFGIQTAFDVTKSRVMNVPGLQSILHPQSVRREIRV
jgi:hypothetical protein